MSGRLEPPIQRTNLGSAICPITHANRVHPLGGGMFVCFECFARLMTGRSVSERDRG
jgi:hypothetical protein